MCTAASLLYPLVFTAGQINIPISERKDKGFLVASMVGFYGTLTAAGIADRNVKQYRYNAYRVFNDEIPYPFNRRHERIMDGTAKVKIGFGNYGYGLLVKL